MTYGVTAGLRALLPFCCALLAFPAAAYDAEDDAGNSPVYDSWDDTDDGGTGFQAWSFNAPPNANSTYTRAAAAASTVGGNSTHLDTAGRCFIQTATNTALGLTEAVATRPLDVAGADGMKVSFVAQRLHASGADTESEIHLLDGSGNPIMYVLCGTLGWRYIAGSTLVASGLAASTPVRIMITTDATAQTFSIEFRQLDGAGLFVNGGVAFDSVAGHPGELRFITRQFDAGVSHVLVNKLIVDPSGTLPVELSDFAVD